MRKLPSGAIRRLSGLRRRLPFAEALFSRAGRAIRFADGVVPHGVGAGLRFNPRGANPGYALGTTEPEVQRALSLCLRPGDVFHDFGANVGFFAILGARLVGPSGRVVAFEALPSNAESVRYNASLNGFATVDVVAKAVGERAGTARIVLAAEPTEAHLAGFGDDTPESESLDVEIVATDDLVRSGAVPPPSLVKIDIEGAEVEALRGLRETVRASAPLLLVENHGRQKEVAALLDEFGYEHIVLGSPGLRLADAAWNAHVLAAPPGRRDVLDRVASRGPDAGVSSA